MDGAIHNFGAGPDKDAAPGDAGVGVAHQHLALQRAQNVAIAGSRLGENLGVKEVHVGVGNVLDGDQPLQFPVGTHGAEGVNLHIAHHGPGGANAHLGVNAGLAADIDVLHLGADVGTQTRRLHIEMLEDKLGFAVDLPGTAGLIGGVVSELVFQVGIGQGGTDGVGVRVFVSDDVYLVSCVCHCRLLPLKKVNSGTVWRKYTGNRAKSARLFLL